jgi:hypothetical protein
MSPRRLPRLLATELALLPSRCQLPIPFAVKLLLTCGQHILRRDVADGTVQADVVVMLDLQPQAQFLTQIRDGHPCPKGCRLKMATFSSAV